MSDVSWGHGNVAGAPAATVIVAVTLSVADVVLLIGEQTALRAVARYSDGSTADVSTSGKWFIDDTEVATVDAAGNVSGLAIGQSSITFSFGAEQARALVFVNVASGDDSIWFFVVPH